MSGYKVMKKPLFEYADFYKAHGAENWQTYCLAISLYHKLKGPAKNHAAELIDNLQPEIDAFESAVYKFLYDTDPPNWMDSTGGQEFKPITWVYRYGTNWDKQFNHGTFIYFLKDMQDAFEAANIQKH